MNTGLVHSLLEAALKARSEEKERINVAQSMEMLFLKRKSEVIDRLSKRHKKL